MWDTQHTRRGRSGYPATYVGEESIPAYTWVGPTLFPPNFMKPEEKGAPSPSPTSGLSISSLFRRAVAELLWGFSYVDYRPTLAQFQFASTSRRICAPPPCWIECGPPPWIPEVPSEREPAPPGMSLLSSQQS